ncbi:MAG TPA: rhodanese-like domain-containing protein [Candidatus Cloacimonetes bacterium]|nr:rhodanese-like domain-containing protein [Candidatus Cloacimonadota bacterium]
MKKRWMISLAVLTAFTVFFFVGCKDKTTENDDGVNEFDVLIEYLEAGNSDYLGWVNKLEDWIKNYAEINTDDYFVLDIRSADDFNDVDDEHEIDHIENAFNATMGTMFDVIETNNTEDKDILIVCYSGQSASFAHMLLRLKNYNAYVLKFGMSIVGEDHDQWTEFCTNDYVDDFVTTESPVLPEFDYPELNTGFETAEEILNARIDAAIALWSNAETRPLIAADAVMEDPDAFNIMNYWGDGDGNGVLDYLELGHIDGAYQLTPYTLTTAENLSVFDPDGNNIFYCYTGQTAAASIAYLTVLGYDVKSIKYGTCSMIWDEMPGHKWPKPYGK